MNEIMSKTTGSMHHMHALRRVALQPLLITCSPSGAKRSRPTGLRRHAPPSAAGHQETSTQRNLPVPAYPPQRSPPPAPPPPPPPPPPPSFTLGGSSRRDIVLGTLITIAVAAGMVSGFSASGPGAQEERELAYVASQLAVPGMPSPVSALMDKQTGKVAAVLVVGRNGARYLATVDPRQPSHMLLQERSGGGGRGGGSRYVLRTRYDAVELANRRQVESIFRVPKWEDALEPQRS